MGQGSMKREDSMLSDMVSYQTPNEGGYGKGRPE